MANVINVRHLKTHTEFNLSNKPNLLCKIDTEDFYEHVEHRTHWYIHIANSENRPDRTNRPYIRSIWKKCVGHLHLHREVLMLGDFCPKDSVADHIKPDETLDNRRENLRHVNGYESSKNKMPFIGRGGDPVIPYYKGCTITYIEKRGYYQAYLTSRTKSIYLSYNKCIVQIKSNIDIKLEQLKQQGEI